MIEKGVLITSKAIETGILLLVPVAAVIPVNFINSLHLFKSLSWYSRIVAAV